MENLEDTKYRIKEYGLKAVVGASLPLLYSFSMEGNKESYCWSLVALVCSEVIYRAYKREKKNLENCLENN